METNPNIFENIIIFSWVKLQASPPSTTLKITIYLEEKFIKLRFSYIELWKKIYWNIWNRCHILKSHVSTVRLCSSHYRLYSNDNSVSLVNDVGEKEETSTTVITCIYWFDWRARTTLVMCCTYKLYSVHPVCIDIAGSDASRCDNLGDCLQRV